MSYKVAIYGAGKRCKNLCSIHKFLDIQIEIIVDSDSKKWGERIDKYYIQSPEELCKFQDVYVCFSLADINTIEKIKEDLWNIYQFKVEKEIGYYELIFEGYKTNLEIKERINQKKNLSRDKEGVLFACPNGFILGGVEAWTEDICKAMIKSGRECINIICGTETHNIPPILKNYIIYTNFDGKVRFKLDVLLNLIVLIMERFPCTVVTNHIDEMFMAACLIKCYCPNIIKIISVIHGGGKKAYDEYANFKKYVNIYIGVSQDIKAAMLKRGIQEKNIYSMTCPFICKQNLNRTYTEDYSMPIRLGYAGRMDAIKQETKRMDLLLKLIGILHEKDINFMLELAGDGKARTEMEKFVLDNGLDKKVKFLGVLKRFEQICFWERQDICINISDSEGRCISRIEAMGSGAVPVVTDTSGTREDIINGVNGFIVPIGDYIAMANRIEYLSNHRKCLHEMGRMAHAMVYPKSRMEPHLGFWEELLFKEE